MKFLFLTTCLLALCSCASGVIDEVEEPVEVQVDPPRIPTPKAPSSTSEPEGEPECVINTYWVGTCYVVKIYCKDKPTRVEVACGPSRPLWPWEVDPYPPPYDDRK